MLGKMYEAEICSAARALEVVGERWSLLILRNAMFAGHTRFSEFQRSLKVAPNILTKRLAEFVEGGLLEVRTPDGGGHASYHLTERGLDLKPAILALTEWGDRWALDPEGRPVTYLHRGCGGEIAVKLTCAECGQATPPADVEARVEPWVIERKYGGQLA
jgi:DNA-binding HxlR family transcriptional regulator